MPGPRRVARRRRAPGSGPAALAPACPCVAGAGVDHQPGRLVDHDHVVVRVHDRHRDVGLGHEPAAAAAIAVDVDLDDVALAHQPRGARVADRRRRRSTAPAATRSATSARLTPVTMATTRSSRSPARASGTISLDDHVRPLGTGRSDARRRRAARRPTTTAHVGDVEHRPPLEVDEVDHRGRRGSRRRRGRPGRARLPSAPPSDRCPRPTAQRAGGRRRQPSHDDQADDHDAGRAARSPGRSRRPRLNAAPVLKTRLKRSVQTRSMVPSVRRRQRPPLGELVERRRRRRRRHHDGRAPDGGPAGAPAAAATVGESLRHVSGGRSPPTLYSHPLSAAHGMARSRSLGIGVAGHCSQMP